MRGHIPIFFVPIMVSHVSAQQTKLEVVAEVKAHGGYVTGVSFSRKGERFVSCDMYGTVKVWDTATLKVLHEVEASRGSGVTNWAYDASISPDGRFFAAGSGDKTVWVWDSGTGKLVQRVRGHDAEIERIVFFSHDNRALSLDRHSVCRVWTVGKEEPSTKLPFRATKAALSKDDCKLMVSDGNKTCLYGLATQQKMADFGSYCADLVFSPDGKFAAKGMSDITKCVELWDVEKNELKWSAKGHQNRVHSIIMAPDGKRIYSIDGVNLHVWETATGDEIGRFVVRKELNLTRFNCSPDGRYLIFGDQKGNLMIKKAPL